MIYVFETNNGIETHIFDPYNELNVLISNDEIHSVLKKYGLNVPIFNYELYKRAFIHRSYTKRPQLENELNNIVIAPKPDNAMDLFTKSNERLELLVMVY